jgi:hypothetical protein
LAGGSQTAAGGEINCVDAGGFGAVLITKAITISCEVGTAGILAPGATSRGIDIAATASDVVTLRGLDIDGQGTGQVGIFVQQAREVHVERCIIRNFRQLSNATRPAYASLANATDGKSGTGVNATRPVPGPR